VREFVEEYFADPARRVMLIAGAGFDPRSTAVAGLLSPILGPRLKGLLIREERPGSDSHLASRADTQLQTLLESLDSCTVERVPVFDTDGTSALGRHVVSGRHVAMLAQRLELEGVTDVVVDFSALSVGTSFPLTRSLLVRLDRLQVAINLHAMVTSSPIVDGSIVPVPSSFVGPVHGFQGRWGIDETARAAKLWLPQLRLGQGKMLEDLYTLIRPDDIVPVLPFPAHDPRLGDRLIEHYAREVENEWAVDPRNIVYAAEGDPLDFYRTVLRLDDVRRPVFESTLGSLLILSPLGSKVLALGAMMAAIERDLPVMYVESLGYQAKLDSSPTFSDENFVHVWLSGDAYSPRR
jgi:hypothetical protein